MIGAILTGQTYFFGDRLDTAGVPGNYGEPDASVKKEYFRILGSVDLTDEEQEKTLMMALTEVFLNNLMLIRVRGKAKDDTGVFNFLRRLEGLDQLYIENVGE